MTEHGDTFAKLPHAVMARRDLTMTAKVVYAAVADRIGAHGKAWPSLRRIASDVGGDVKTIIRAIAALRAAGLLIIESGGPGKSNAYRLMGVGEMPALAKCQRSQNANSGVGKMPTRALAKCQRNQTQPDQLNQTHAARPGDALWNVVREVFGLTPATKADRSRIGRIVRDLKVKGGTPDELRIRVARYRAEWPRCECTPEALLKHWDRFATERKPAGHGGRPDLTSNERYRALVAT